jgi:hypothetical protein
MAIRQKRKNEELQASPF